MAQDTWGLKLDSELKEKVQSIIKNDFESSKDFLEQLVNLYNLNKLKQEGGVLSSEIDELESITKRINNIFINANEKVQSLLTDKDIKANEQVSLKQNIIERLQNTIKELEEDKERISGINDTLVESNTDYQNKTEQLIKTNITLEELVAEYKDKNSTLTGTLDEYKLEHNKNKELQEQVLELRKTISDLTSTNKTQLGEINILNRRLEEDTQKYQNELQSITNVYESRIKSEIEQAEIKHNRELVEQQRIHQSEIKDIQGRFASEIERYQTKYRELLEEIESIKRDVVKEE